MYKYKNLIIFYFFIIIFYFFIIIRWIVTAAQCLRWKNTINVHIGIGSNGVASKQIAVPPSNQYIYPEFGEYRKFHDIGKGDKMFLFRKV